MYRLIATLCLTAVVLATLGMFRAGARKKDASETAVVTGSTKPAWLTLEEAAAKMQRQSKPLLIDLYTDWCGWCKVMDKKTYTHPELVRYLEDKYYPVKLDAESRKEIVYNGRTFRYNANNKVNDLAVYLTGGRLSFPTTIIVPADGSAPQAIPGYLKPDEMEIILKYFGEGHYPKTPFPEYAKQFKAAWK